MKVYIQAEYAAISHAKVDLPIGRTWEDVEHYFIKWETLSITFKDGTAIEVEMQPECEIDYKRPVRVHIWNCSEDGTIDFTNQIENYDIEN